MYNTTTGNRSMYKDLSYTSNPPEIVIFIAAPHTQSAFKYMSLISIK